MAPYCTKYVSNFSRASTFNCMRNSTRMTKQKWIRKTHLTSCCITERNVIEFKFKKLDTAVIKNMIKKHAVVVEKGQGRGMLMSAAQLLTCCFLHSKTVQWTLTKTVATQLQRRDELRNIYSHFLCDFWTLYDLTLSWCRGLGQNSRAISFAYAGRHRCQSLRTYDLLSTVEMMVRDGKNGGGREDGGQFKNFLSCA